MTKYEFGVNKCGGCGKKTTKLCDDGWCKKCHQSCSWEACVTGTWNANVGRLLGRSKKSLKKQYPKAKI